MNDKSINRISREAKKIPLDNINAVIDRVNALWKTAYDPTMYSSVSMTASGLKLVARKRHDFPWDKMRFGWSLVRNVFTVNAGSVCLYGIGKYDVAETSVTLSGSVEHVYAQLALGGNTPTIQHSSTAPSVTDPVYWNFPLYTLTAQTGTNAYTLTWIHQVGDIKIGSAIA